MPTFRHEQETQVAQLLKRRLCNSIALHISCARGTVKMAGTSVSESHRNFNLDSVCQHAPTRKNVLMSA